MLRRAVASPLEGLAVAFVDYTFTVQGLQSCTWALRGDDAQVVDTVRHMLGEPIAVNMGQPARAVWPVGHESAELWRQQDGLWRLSRSQHPAMIGILGVRNHHPDLLSTLMATGALPEEPMIDVFTIEDAQ